MDAYGRLRRENSAFDVDYDLAAGAVAATHLQTVKSTSHRIYVQKIIISYLTHVDGKTIDFQDDANTPVVIARRLDDAEGDSTANADVIVIDFGPKGTPLTLGKNLDIVANTGGTGSTGRIHIEGYQKLEGVVAGVYTGTALVQG